jgi:hypothetical protein
MVLQGDQTSRQHSSHLLTVNRDNVIYLDNVVSDVEPAQAGFQGTNAGEGMFLIRSFIVEDILLRVM